MILTTSREVEDLRDVDEPGRGCLAYRAIVNAGLGEAFMKALEKFHPDGLDETELDDLLADEAAWCMKIAGMA